VQRLLEAGADVNQYSAGWLAIHVAADNDERELASLLVAHGASLRMPTETPRASFDDVPEGMVADPVEFAKFRGHREMVLLLTNHRTAPQSQEL
jgi:hypothetical protein